MSFGRIRLVVGEIVAAAPFPKAKKPAYQIHISFGPIIGVRQSSAQLTQGYPDPEDLVGRLAVAVLNFPRRLVAGFRSEVLILGFYQQEHVVKLMQPLGLGQASHESLIGQRIGLATDKEGLVVPQAEDEIGIDVFLDANIVIGTVRALLPEGAAVDCGPAIGSVGCPLVDGLQLQVGDAVVLLHGDQLQGNLLAVKALDGQAYALTSSTAIPEGARLQ